MSAITDESVTLSAFFLACAVVLIALIWGMTYYNTETFRTAVSKGLCQELVNNQTIWTRCPEK